MGRLRPEQPVGCAVRGQSWVLPAGRGRTDPPTAGGRAQARRSFPAELAAACTPALLRVRCVARVLVLLLAQWLWTVPGGGVTRRGQPVGPQWMGKGLPKRSVGSVRAVDGTGGRGGCLSLHQACGTPEQGPRGSCPGQETKAWKQERRIRVSRAGQGGRSEVGGRRQWVQREVELRTVAAACPPVPPLGVLRP